MSDRLNEYADFLDEDGEEAGLTKVALQNAIQVYDFLQPGPKKTIAEIAKAFHCTPECIAAAVRDHYWMFIPEELHREPLTGEALDRATINHEGE